jgi:hypothetical protein
MQKNPVAGLTPYTAGGGYKLRQSTGGMKFHGKDYEEGRKESSRPVEVKENRAEIQGETVLLQEE